MSQYVEGLADLSKKFDLIGRKASVAALRSATVRATTPVIKAMRAAAPKGTRPHKTYRGRLVAPGFASRQITKRTRFFKATGTVRVTIGVRKEAFYLIQFLDHRPGRTPYRVTQRKMSGYGPRVVREHARVTKTGKKRTVRAHETRGRGRRTIQVKPYRIPATPWFSSVFIKHRDKMLQTFRDVLGENIRRAARGH